MKSDLQIISGKYRGRKLSLPNGARPTQNKARIALFNMLDDVLANDNRQLATVWDAFAGSGAFGIEWLSRTDANVIFTDTSSDSIKTIKLNAGFCVAHSAFHIEQADALNAMQKYGAISDIIFIDPPYDKHDLGVALVRKLTSVAKPGAVVVWEMDAAPIVPDGWTILKDKTYGRARFLILQKA